MPQYMMSVHMVDGKQPYADEAEAEAAYARTAEFNKKLQEAGAWVFAGGLEPRETATTVDNTGAEPIVTDGPFAETKEWLGGFWVIDAPDLDAALQWAKEGSAACGGAVEVRPFQD